MIEYKARSVARHWIENIVKSGDTVVDATMGNGHDTLMLAHLVGKEGAVFAFDVQNGALEATHKRLAQEEISNVRLILCGHERMDSFVHVPVSCVVFNLGWLPSGDKNITTMAATTIEALNKALVLLKKGGIISICIYPGHPEGKREKEEILKWASALSDKEFAVMHTYFANQGNDPPENVIVGKL